AVRMSAGRRWPAIAAHAPASWAMRACSAVTTSMITPPLSIWARPVLTLKVPLAAGCPLPPFRCATIGILRGGCRQAEVGRAHLIGPGALDRLMQATILFACGEPTTW